MKDNAVQDIAKVRQKDKLANDASVAARNKKGVGKRDDKKNRLSSSKAPSFNAYNNFVLKNNKGNIGSEVQKIRQKKQDSLMKVAEMIPVLNRYAKLAKMISKVNASKSKKRGILGESKDNDKIPNQAELEEAENAEKNGEEYKQENVESKFTAITNKKLKIFIFASMGGMLFSLVFTAIILMASITTSGGEAYLATKSNPTEEELEKEYTATEEEDRDQSSDSEDSDDSNSNSSSNSENSNNSNSGNNKSKIILVGDSRMVGICSSVSLSSNEDCELAKGSMGYSWFSATALPSIKSKLNNNKDSIVVIYMGTNDMYDEAVNNNKASLKYAKDYNQLAEDYKNSKIIAVSVTPIDDAKAANNGYLVKNSHVINFNNSLKKSLASNVKYCDVYSKIINNYNASDGVHFDADTNKKIYSAIKNCM